MMAQGDDGHFYCGFRFLSQETNSALQALRAGYEVRLIETRRTMEKTGWVITPSAGRVISHAAQMAFVDLLVEMVEALYETAARGYFTAVGSSEYKARVDLVERQLNNYGMRRWRQLLRGLPLESVGFDPGTGATLGSNEVLLAETLAAHLRSKALDLELQMWQREATGQSGHLDAFTDLQNGTTARSVLNPVADISTPASKVEGDRTDGNVSSAFKKKRGRPPKIPDELKQQALGVSGGKARAQILYRTNYPTPQQVKNVSSILRHHRRKRSLNQS
jgi:hypothetical protein